MRMPTLAGGRAIPFGGSWSTDSVVGLQDSAESVLLEPPPPSSCVGSPRCLRAVLRSLAWELHPETLELHRCDNLQEGCVHSQSDWSL